MVNTSVFSTYAAGGGYKQSGVGRELGKWGLAEYHELKHIHVGESVPADQKIYFGALFN